MRFQRRGVRERIVAPDRGEIVASSKPQPDGMLVKALARALRWQRMLDEGQIADVAELADVERVNPSYVSGVLRLTLLAPDIVEGHLDGRQPKGLTQLLRRLHIEWERQRSEISDQK